MCASVFLYIPPRDLGLALIYLGGVCVCVCLRASECNLEIFVRVCQTIMSAYIRSLPT